MLAVMTRRLSLWLLLVTVIGVAGCSVFVGNQTRPTGAITEDYVLEYAYGAEPFARLTVDKDAAACLTLRSIELADRSHGVTGTASPLPTDPEPILYVACVLATNIDARFIAGEAFGRLNEVDTPALEAIIWRARLDADRTVCENAGLLGERLHRCRAAVDADDYRVSDGPLTVVIAPQASAAP
ncbi:MAG: hypothetical protein L0221_01070 [Chloroflexi bacterium]|nr:hypothetical protein [Chloroflexota bacterium]